MNTRLLIKNGLIVFPDKIKKQDLLIEKGKIKKIQASITEQVDSIDASNRYILPGGIDVHTHMDLEVANKTISSDDYQNGSKAGLMGGITTFFGFAYQKNDESLCKTAKREEKKAKKSYCDYKLHIGVSSQEKQLKKELNSVLNKTYQTVKIHLNDSRVDTVFLSKVFQILKKKNALGFLHCEDGKIIDWYIKKCKKKKKLLIKHYPLIRKDYVEKIAINTVLILARHIKNRIYIAHLSSKAGLDTITEQIKDKYLKVDVETCPQYLLFTDNAYKRKDGYLYTCSPSFKTNEDQKALWNGLRKGYIKVVSSDHCPFTQKQKKRGENNFTKSPLGLPGIETLYPLMLSEGRKRKFKIQDVVNWISTNPAKIFGLYPEKGIIKQGSTADLVIYNLDKSYIIQQRNLAGAGDYSPYEGIKVEGMIEKVILNGRMVVSNNEFQI